MAIHLSLWRILGLTDNKVSKEHVATERRGVEKVECIETLPSFVRHGLPRHVRSIGHNKADSPIRFFQVWSLFCSRPHYSILGIRISTSNIIILLSSIVAY